MSGHARRCPDKVLVMTTIPTWLKDRLGGPSRRNATVERCRDCRAHILTGLDDDVAAIRVTVDPVPLTVMGEAMALLAGRGSYMLKPRKTGLALWRRDHWQIAGVRPAADVVATHRCGEPLQAFRTASVFTRRDKPKSFGGGDDPPPF